MMPAIRVKFGLLSIASLLLAAFAWSGASGQFRPPFNPPRPFNPGARPPGGMGGMNRPGGITIGWKCPKCGRTGDGAIPPQTCPGCGVHFINGMGNGSAGGIFGNAPGAGPMNPNPVGMNPGAPPFGPPPAFNPPPASGPNVNPPANGSSEALKPSVRKPLVIVLVIGIIVVGVSVLVGGTLLVIYNLRNNNSSARRSRSRRDEYYD